MPFSGSTYTLPAGSLVSNGVLSDASQHNTPLEDIEDSLTSVKTIADGAAQKSNNLSDLPNAATARTNLGATAVGSAVFTAANEAAARSAIKVYDTYIDARLYGVAPDQTDNAAKLQAAHDANRGATIVVPYYGGAALKLEAQVHLEWECKLLFQQTNVQWATGTYLAQPLIAIRRRTSGAAHAGKMTDIYVEGLRAFVAPAVTATLVPTAGQTVLPIVSGATSKLDFAVYKKTSGGVVTTLSTVTDLVDGDSNHAAHITLAVAANGTDTYYIAAVKASARNAIIGVEGTAIDTVGRVFLKDIYSDGLPYVTHQLQYVDHVEAVNIAGSGAADRGTLYPYLGVDYLYASNIKGKATPDAGFGANELQCFYGFNVNDSLAEGTVKAIRRMKIVGLDLENYKSQGVNLSGDVEDAQFETCRLKNTGLYNILTGHSVGGTAERIAFSDVICHNVSGENAVSQAIYNRSDNTSYTDVQIHGANLLGFLSQADSGARMSNVNVRNMTITGAAQAGTGYGAQIVKNDKSKFDITVESCSGTGGGVFVSDCQKSVFDLVSNDNAGAGVYLNGSSFNHVTAKASGNSGIGFRVDPTSASNTCIVDSSGNTAQGVYIEGDRNNVLATALDNGSVGVQIVAGGDNNIVAGLSLGNTGSQVSNAGTNNNVANLKVT